MVKGAKNIYISLPSIYPPGFDNSLNSPKSLDMILKVLGYRQNALQTYVIKIVIKILSYNWYAFTMFFRDIPADWVFRSLVKYVRRPWKLLEKSLV